MSKINLVWWKFDPSEAYERDWIDFLLSDFEVNHVVDFANESCLDNSIIVANLSRTLISGKGGRNQYQKELVQFNQYLDRLKAQNFKAGLIHLGDEFYKETTSFYNKLDFVFRHYRRAEAQRNHPQCYYLPLGYKSDFCKYLDVKNINERGHVWSFAGELKGSRYDMLKYAKSIPGGKYHVTTQWNDPNGLNTQQYAELLSDTVFTLCPRGNYSVDCFRVYEALEAGSIPIIETQSYTAALKMLLNPKFIMGYGIWDSRFWLRNYNYWDKAYPANFPCYQINNWKDLQALINSIDTQDTSKKIRAWWQEYKRSLVHLVKNTVEKSFFSKI